MTAAAWTEVEELVVPVDGRGPSVRALPVAVRLAERLDCTIRLIAAATEDSNRLEGWMHLIADQYVENRLVEIEVIDSHDPVAAIAQSASGSRLVCMATAGSLRPHQGHAGSVAEGVVRRVRKPVFLVGPHMAPRPPEHTSRVIIPVDGSPLSETALPVGADLAARLKVPAWVVSVVPATPGQPVSGRAAESAYVRDVAERIGANHGIDAEYEVLHGRDPAVAIVDFAGDDGTVVMTTHGRSGLSRLFAGSVTTAVVAHSHRAVLVWRPDEAE